MWGEGAYSSTHILRCKHQNPVAWKNSKTTGEGCSCSGLPELPKKRSPPYARPQHGVSFCGGSDSPCHESNLWLFHDGKRHHPPTISLQGTHR